MTYYFIEGYSVDVHIPPSKTTAVWYSPVEDIDTLRQDNEDAVV
jgi:hypothetical protein